MTLSNICGFKAVNCFCKTSTIDAYENKSLRKKLAKVNQNENNTAGIYLLNAINGNIRTICESCSKLAIKTAFF